LYDYKKNPLESGLFLSIAGDAYAQPWSFMNLVITGISVKFPLKASYAGHRVTNQSNGAQSPPTPNVIATRITIRTQIAMFNAIDWTAWNRRKGISFFSSINRRTKATIGMG
jgi:hypothetical protein